MNFFKLFTSNFVGLLTGAGVACIICLILGFTVFKHNKIAGAILSIIIIIAFALAGSAIQYYCDSSKLGVDATAPTNQENAEHLNKDIINGWLNTNGGFTFEQIKQAQEDNECPTYPDQVIDLKVTDFDKYVTFSFKDGNVYRNAMFLKTSKGLIYDGMLNMTGDFNTYWVFPVFTAVDLDSWTWDYSELKKEPYYWEKQVLFDKFNNKVSVSDNDSLFMKRKHKLELHSFDGRAASNRAIREGVSMIASNITKYFIKFGNIELVGAKDNATIAINTFYNYLFSQIKTINYNTSKVVDSADLLCVPIPDDEQTKYPVSQSFKAIYPDIDYYGVYRCDIGVNLTYVKGNKNISTTSNTEDYLKDNDRTDATTVETIDTTSEICQLNITLKDIGNSDLSKVDLSSKPVEIVFTSGTLTKKLTIDNIATLNSTLTVLLDRDIEWKYQIYSDELIFDNFRGTFTLTTNKMSTSFEYYYMDRYVVATVGLNPIGTIDKSQIDLVNNPVKVILANDKHTYQFVFDDNSKLDTAIPSTVEMGDYEYTILSRQLIFASVSGKLTITSTDKDMLFNYAITLVKDDLLFKIEYSNVPYSTYTAPIQLNSDSNNVNLIRSKLSGSKKYNVVILFYDENGKMVQSYTHLHSDTGACFDKWTDISNLENGNTYTVQIRFTDVSDSTKTYLSDVLTLTYDSSLIYRFIYNVTEVA